MGGFQTKIAPNSQALMRPARGGLCWQFWMVGTFGRGGSKCPRNFLKDGSRPDVNHNSHQKNPNHNESMLAQTPYPMSDSPITSASLILRLQSSDDSGCWSEFVSLYQATIYQTARRTGLSHADADEVTQEVLLRVLQSIERWDPDRRRGSFRGWLYRIARNLSIDYLRKSSRQPVSGNSTGMMANLSGEKSDGDRHEFDRQLERQVFRKAADRVTHGFSETTWQAFWRTAVEGRSPQQVARELNVSRGAVYIARSRVMARLKREVATLMNETLGES